MANNLAQEIMLAGKCRGVSFQKKVKLHKKVCALGYKRRFTYLRKRKILKPPLKRNRGRKRNVKR